MPTSYAPTVLANTHGLQSLPQFGAYELRTSGFGCPSEYETPKNDFDDETDGEVI